MLHREVEKHDRERELDRAPHNEKIVTGVFLWDLQNSEESSLLQNTSSGYFWNWRFILQLLIYYILE